MINNPTFVSTRNEKVEHSNSSGKRKVFTISKQTNLDQIQATFNNYLSERKRFNKQFLGIADRFFGGCSLNEKVAAVSAINQFLNKTLPIDELERTHKKALNQGHLGKLFNALKKTDVYNNLVKSNSLNTTLPGVKNK